ncbi:MAG TPA: hypothetical protein VFA54_16720 [Bryobacterales bacterium]|nr:hypothetical protein [Bryobacterales bacterium]
MSKRIGTALALGAWLAATLFMWLVATQNFHLVDRLLAAPSPDFARRIAGLASGEARLLLRYQASEVNRWFFDRWGWTQLGLGVILSILVSRAAFPRKIRISIFLMLLIAAVLQIYVVPEIVRLGRLLDFAVRTPPPPQEVFFWRLHAAYTALDMLKFLLGVYVAAGLLRDKSWADAAQRS